MIKGLTFFRKKIKTMAQTTIPITAALAIIIMLAGTTTVGVISVWASAFPGPNGQIAFVRSNAEESESFEIYVMNADDGSEQTRLTDNDADDGAPSWSPDGTKIAFSSNRDSIFLEIYVMNADDGSEQTRLTDNSADDEVPDWGTNTSPPGSGGGSTTPSEQAIDETIFTIQDLDLLPQNLKTDINTLLEEVSNMVNDDIQITIDQIMARFLVP
jgi:WD40-like Beta Propeller Repeat